MRSRRSLKSVGLGLVDVLGSLSEVVLAGLLMLASTLLVMAFQFFAPYLLVVALAGVALLLYYLLQLMLQHLLVVLFALLLMVALSVLRRVLMSVQTQDRKRKAREVPFDLVEDEAPPNKKDNKYLTLEDMRRP